MSRLDEIRNVFLEILSVGILRIRSLAFRGMAEECAVEADHLHNLPMLLMDLKPELILFYWEIEKPVFAQQASLGLEQFQPLWSRLEKLIQEET